jgi:hypothetical protein
VDSVNEKTKLRITSIASDGEARRGAAFIELTFQHELSPNSPIYPLLQPLKFLDLHVGDDDLTCDKDYKHIFKRFRNLFVRERGVVIMGCRITPNIMMAHFKSEGLSADHIRSLFNPDDAQDVKLAFDMLKDVWNCLAYMSCLAPSPQDFCKLGKRFGFLGSYYFIWSFHISVLTSHCQNKSSTLVPLLTSLFHYSAWLEKISFPPIFTLT